MPGKAIQTPCSYTGCRRPAVRNGRCRVHQRQREQEGKPTTKYSSRQWREARLEYLLAHPRCEVKGCHAAAALVHHRIPVDRGGSDDWENLMAMCWACHSRYTLDEQRQGR